MNSMLEVFSRVIRTLEAHDIEYMVVGSIASMIYGEPRLTGDMDIVVELKPRMVPQLEGMFPEHDFYLPPREILSQEVVPQNPRPRKLRLPAVLKKANMPTKGRRNTLSRKKSHKGRTHFVEQCGNTSKFRGTSVAPQT